MTAINNLSSFALAGGANVKSGVAWAADPTRLQGFVDGVADVRQFNTAMRQVSFVTTMIAQFCVDNALIDVNDDGNIGALENTFEAALLAYVLSSPLLHAQVQQGVYRTPGTFTFTVPPHVTQLRISLWGGGGGGAGVATYTNQASGGGGGGFAFGVYTVLPLTVYSMTIGAGGSGGAAGNTTGQNGGTSSFDTLISATGGQPGGPGTATGGAGPGYGGSGLGGSLNLIGGKGRGGPGILTPSSTLFLAGGDGGSSWCSGEIPFSGGAAHSGEMPGQGGSGGSTGSSAGAVAGGAGSPGMILIDWTV